MEYKFAYSSFGWNWLYFPGKPDPVTHVLTGAGWYNVNNKEFQTADDLDDGKSLTPGARDFNKLFSVGAEGFLVTVQTSCGKLPPPFVDLTTTHTAPWSSVNSLSSSGIAFTVPTDFTRNTTLPSLFSPLKAGTSDWALMNCFPACPSCGR